MRKRYIVLSMLIVFTFSQLFAKTVGQDITIAPGQIAFIGRDFNVYSVHTTNMEQRTLTTDAEARRRYMWPTWSTDGRLAYFCCDPATSTQVEIEVFATQPHGEVGERLFIGQNQVFTYAYWSPDDCQGVANCRDLAVLVTTINPQGLALQIIRQNDETHEQWTAERGAPFYFTWRETGDQMIWLRNETAYEVYDVTSRVVQERLEFTPGRSVIPIWADARIFLSTRGERAVLTDVVAIESGQSQTILSGFDSALSFLISPDGQYLAYRRISSTGLGQLVVVNAITGVTIAESPADGVIAFFWSPNSGQIAYVTLSDQPGAFSAKIGDFAQQDQPLQLMWQVLDIQSGQNNTLTRFSPTADMIYLLSFFEQFAHSHRIWSPDSSHIVYAETVQSGNSVVRIVDVTITDSQPITIADGYIGIWSFD